MLNAHAILDHIDDASLEVFGMDAPMGQPTGGFMDSAERLGLDSDEFGERVAENGALYTPIPADPSTVLAYVGGLLVGITAALKADLAEMPTDDELTASDLAELRSLGIGVDQPDGSGFDVDHPSDDLDL